MSELTQDGQILNVLSRFSNSFDTKDWPNLEACLADFIDVDYSDLRNTPPETLTSGQFVSLRRDALDSLQTHHLGANPEISITGDVAEARLSMLILRKNRSGEVFHTHCIYQFKLKKNSQAWKINAIIQKVFWSDGNSAIHSGALGSKP